MHACRDGRRRVSTEGRALFRTPRTSPHTNSPRSISRRVSGIVSRKTLAYAGAGLALAGTGAGVAMTGFAGNASATDTENFSRATTQAIGQHNAPVKPSAAHAGHASARAEHTTPARHDAPAKHEAAAKHTASAKHTTPAKHEAPAKHTTPAKHAAHAKHAKTWAAVSAAVARETFPKAKPGTLPARDKLTPAGTSGPQSWMPITAARYENAKAIVRQALAKHMGLRAAVVAVATAMQESTLLNINYGTADSVGLFQQRPSCGWGTVAQIMHPAYAADAFLNALHSYAQRDPGWASQPLWQSAQGVQASGFPTAYAKWEAQAAHLVEGIARQLA